MSHQTKTGKDVEKALQSGSPDMAETLRMQMRALLQEQAELIEETQKSMTAWTSLPASAA